MALNAKLISMPEPPAHALLEAPVRKVTLLEDRAQVVREGKARLEEGSQRLRVRGVAPVAADRSLLVRVPGARVDESRVLRTWRIGTEEKPEASSRLYEEIDALDALLRHRGLLIESLEQRRARAEQSADLLVDSINRELPFAEGFDPRWPKGLEGLLASVRSLDGEIAEARKHLNELQSQREAMTLRSRQQGRPDHELVTEIEIQVTAEKAGEYSFTVQYLVPCAFWRPIHRATLVDGTMRFECEGALWQATGEDWDDVELYFSTARPRERSEPPVLSDDLVSARRKESKKVQVAVREQAIATTGEGQAKLAGELPGVDDGGETRLLGAARRASVTSDGRLRRVPIFAFETKAEVDLISRPERSALVHLRSKQPNLSPHPILAGPVELLRESGYVGRSTILFVAPGENFVFGWGAQDGLRVRRTTSEKRESAMLTGKQTITRTVELSLSNLDDASARFRLEERIPVSEIDAVSVKLDEKESSPGSAVDDQGIVSWTVSLPPHGTQTVKLVYRLIASSDVQGL